MNDLVETCGIPNILVRTNGGACSFVNVLNELASIIKVIKCNLVVGCVPGTSFYMFAKMSGLGGRFGRDRASGAHASAPGSRQFEAD